MEVWQRPPSRLAGGLFIAELESHICVNTQFFFKFEHFNVGVFEYSNIETFDYLNI